MMAAIPGGSPCSFPQGGLRIDVTRLQRRHQSERQRRYRGRREREEQAGGIQTNRLGRRWHQRASGQRHQRVYCPIRDQEAGCAATCRQHYAFDH